MAPVSVVAQESTGGSSSEGIEKARSSVGRKPAVDWGEDFQIRVFGENPTLRVLFVSFSRGVQDDFRNVLLRRRPGDANRHLEWAVPIRIDLWGGPDEVHKGRDVRTSVEIGPDDQFLIRMSVKVHDRFREESFRLELVKALLIEQMIGPFVNDPASFQKSSVHAPEWLAYGFDELLQHRGDGQPSAFYRGILESGQMLGPEKLAEIGDPAALDPVTRAAFRASAAAFVEALLNQPGGEVGVRSMLADLGRSGSGGAIPVLRQHFPAFREMEQGMDKWWALEVATMGLQQGFEYMSPEETEKWLTDALTVTIKPEAEQGSDEKQKPAGLKFFQRFKKKKTEDPPAPNVPVVEVEPFVGEIDRYAEFKNMKGSKEQLEACFLRLQRVKRTGFPLYRPVFARYEVILKRLAGGKVKGIDIELEEASKMRTKISETLVKTKDYLNYFEATQAPKRSGVFDDYLELRRMLEENMMPRRDDRITRFLDKVESSGP